MNNFFIITGGPGSGKTTLINELKKQGFEVIPEGARKIIKHQLAINGNALPHKDLNQFKEEMLSYVCETYKNAKKYNPEDIVFFDCGILEIVAYNSRTHTQNSESLIKAINEQKYNQNVFIASPWKEIFCQDNERTQTFEESIEVYNAKKNTYVNYGYKLIKLPKVSVLERVNFIKKIIFNVI